MKPMDKKHRNDIILIAVLLVVAGAAFGLIQLNKKSGYTQIGKKYVDYVKKTSEMPGIDVSDVLKMLDPKFERRDELQAKMIEIEKRRKDRTLLQEKFAVEAQVQAEIEKLDKALAMELIGQAEYDTKVAQLKKRVDNFEAIKKVEQKCQMGIITAAERDKEIEALLM